MAKAVRLKQNVRLRVEAYDTLERIVGQVAQFGWASVGRQSTESATREAVAAYAIEMLASQVKSKRRG